MQANQKVGALAIASYIVAAVLLILIMERGLLDALFAGLLANSLVHTLAPALGRNISGKRARIIAVALLGMVVVILLTAVIWGAVSYFGDEHRIPILLQKMADIIEASRGKIPDWIKLHLPDSVESLRGMFADWMREHAVEARNLGEQVGRVVAHLLIGMIIGAMAALYDTATTHQYKPLTAILYARIVTLSQVFERIVFAQTRISAINTFLTSVFLLAALPLVGVHLPLVKTMIAVTFIVGLVPIVGNLISNTMLVIISLSHSLNTAIVSLVFLVTIHKLEYFLNAKIIGNHIDARVWELLTAMLLMESLFGIPGVIAAPVFYAYVKRELAAYDLI